MYILNNYSDLSLPSKSVHISMHVSTYRQMYDPCVLKHSSFSLQRSPCCVHSSISEHSNSSPTYDPSYPVSHSHVNDPSVSTQTELTKGHDDGRSHSFTLVHVLPSPSYPAGHSHRYDPSVSTQLSSLKQSLVSALKHSLMLEQDVRPSPSYPSLHSHENDPLLFTHCPFNSGSKQSSVPNTHSSISEKNI